MSAMQVRSGMAPEESPIVARCRFIFPFPRVRATRGWRGAPQTVPTHACNHPARPCLPPRSPEGCQRVAGGEAARHLRTAGENPGSTPEGVQEPHAQFTLSVMKTVFLASLRDASSFCRVI